MTLTVLPGDFAVVPIAGDLGKVIEAALWVQEVVESRKLGIPRQKYEHAEIYVGMADKAGPYGYTYSAYPNRKGKQALPCPPDQLQGVLWSSGYLHPDQNQRDAIVAWCLAHPSVQYGSLDYLALTAHTLGLNTTWLQHVIDDQKSLICSQYTDAAWNAGGYHLFNDGRWDGFVTPLDLALLLEAKGAAPLIAS